MKASWLDKITKFLFITSILLLNFMKVVHMGNVNFNMALSDVLLPVVLLVLLINGIRNKFDEVFFLWQWAIVLIIWLILTGVLGIENPNIQDAGIKGMVSELVKTAISVGYFYVGYNILKKIDIKLFKLIWLINAITFIGFGFLFTYLVRFPMFYEILDSRYKIYFMGTYTDPNHAATLLGINTIVLLNWGFREQNKILKCIYLCVSVASGIVILLTDSRGGLLGLLVALTLFCIIHWKYMKKYLLEIMTALVAGVVSIFVIDFKLNQNEFVSNFYQSFINFGNGINIRESLARTAFHMGIDHPIFGVGRGNYALNSRPYFDKLGFSFIENIPHNTYIGIFAESGIIGLLIFAFPIGVLTYYLIKNNTKEKWAHLISMILPLVFIIGMQGAILNVENQRVLWFLLGVALYNASVIMSNSIQPDVSSISTLAKTENRKRGIIRIICVAIIGLLLLFGNRYMYFNLPYISVTENYEAILPISVFAKPQEYELAYSILVKQKNFNQHGVEVRLMEKHEDGKIDVLDRRLYSQVNGVEKIKFYKKDEKSEIVLVFNNINPKLVGFRAKLSYLKSDEVYLNLDKKYLISKNFLNATPYYKLSNQNEPVSEYYIEELDDYCYGDLLVKTLSYRKEGTVNILKLRLEVTKDISNRVKFWLYGVPDNISVLAESELASGVKYFTSTEKASFDNLHEHQILYLTYEIPGDSEYLIRFGGIEYEDDVRKGIIDYKTQKTSIELGQTKGIEK